MSCDLHTHSNYSDGTMSPSELITEAKRLGITIALTDHNTVAGATEFLAEAERLGVTAVAGTELTVDYKGTELHLLGLFIAPEHFDELERLTRKYALLKERNNAELIGRLNKAGYRIDYEKVKAHTAKGNVNRAHIAAELVTMGYVACRDEAFDTLLKEGNGFYFPSERLDVLEAIGFFANIKALPVLAHPMKELDETALRAFLPEAIAAGLVGMEVMHSDYSAEDADIAAKTAKEFGLLPSGGSDFHGANKPHISLGTGKGRLSVPDGFYEGLYKEKNRRCTE
ncbi:MAG: PHP domain-containing protein [Clostridia bacterium]|nr:PHP domain-containing protein [Clostridia bacterium]